MRVAYLVSRFPHVSETFIVRELDAVSACGVEIDLRSLFPPVDAVVHPAARPWVAGLGRPGPLDAALGLGAWLLRRPLRLSTSVAIVVAAYARHPPTLVRALATVALGAAHARSLSRNGIRHVHAHYATYPALAAWLCGRLAGTTYSFTAHAHDLYVRREMLRRKAADAAFVVTISEFNRRYLDGARRIEVVRCGIDPSSRRFAPRAPAPTGEVRALCVASLQEYKGHRYLIEALGLPGLERVTLDLVGSGGLRPDLERRARELGVAERVRFHGGLPEPDVERLLERADLFVLPSVVARDRQMEGVPVALMEALAAGVPVVATRLSGVPELIRDGETGLLAAPEDAEELAERMLAVIGDADAALARAERGRRLVEEEFDVRRSGRRMAELLRAFC